MQVTLLSGWSLQNIIFQGKSKFSWLVEFAQVNIDLFEVTASCCPLQLNGAVIARVPTYKLFGVIILQDLTSNEHCDHIDIIGTLRYSDYVLPTTVGCVLPMSGVLGQVLTVGRKKNGVKLIDCKVQTTVKAAVFSSKLGFHVFAKS